MMFDGVTLPALLFFCILMVMALIGNSLVLLVFGCRWRTTNDTKIYIMALAALDLLGAMVSFPRVLISLFPVSLCLVKKSHMRAFCKLFTFFTGHFSITSALILVAIAASRYVKVTKRDSSSGRRKLREPGACSAVKTRLRRIFRSFKTVRGAKISVGVALCLAALNTCPSLFLFGSGETEETSFMNTSLLFSNGTAEEDYSACHTTCRDDIHPDYKVFIEALDISHFVLFAILAMLLISIYGTILQKLYRRKRSRACRPGSARREGSFFSPEESTISSMAPFQHKTDETSFENQSPHSLTTTESVSAEEGSTQPASPISVDVVINGDRAIEEKAMLPTQKRARPQSDFVQYRHDNSHELTLFPPLSYSSEHWSDVSLNRLATQPPENQSQAKLNNRLSTASFQLVKTGNQTRLTTLVFLLVTLIYIVSYCPYFVFVLLMYTADPEAGEPWQSWGVSGKAVIEICRRSYLIAHAANPLVYGLCNPYFREQLGKLLICRRDVI